MQIYIHPVWVFVTERDHVCVFYAMMSKNGLWSKHDSPPQF